MTYFDSSKTTDDKRVARFVIYNMASQFLGKSVERAFLLPGRSPEASAELMKEFIGVDLQRVVAVDKDKKAFEAAQVCGFRAHSGDIRSFHYANGFQFVDLDLCNTAEKAAKASEYMTPFVYQKKGLMAVCFCASRDQLPKEHPQEGFPYTEFVRDYGHMMEDSYVPEQSWRRAHLVTKAVEQNSGLRLVSSVYYKGTTPSMLYLLFATRDHKCFESCKVDGSFISEIMSSSKSQQEIEYMASLFGLDRKRTAAYKATWKRRRK